jgi:hypothetical protein
MDIQSAVDDVPFNSVAIQEIIPTDDDDFSFRRTEAAGSYPHKNQIAPLPEHVYMSGD